MPCPWRNTRRCSRPSWSAMYRTQLHPSSVVSLWYSKELGARNVLRTTPYYNVLLPGARVYAAVLGCVATCSSNPYRSDCPSHIFVPCQSVWRSSLPHCCSKTCMAPSMAVDHDANSSPCLAALCTYLPKMALAAPVLTCTDI